MAKPVEIIPSPVALDKAIKVALERSYLEALKLATPLLKTGATAQGWKLKKARDGTWEFSNSEGFTAQALDEGMKPQIIRPVRKKMLRFPIPSGKRKSPYKPIPGNRTFVKDGFVFTMAVRHPGFAARRYIDKVMDDPKNELRFQEELQNLLFAE